MATRRIAALVAALALFIAPLNVQAQVITTTTSTVPGFDQIYDRFVTDLPTFCRSKERAQKHCAIAPLLYDAGQVWKSRAEDQLVKTRECNKNLGSCENALANDPTPVEPPGPDLSFVAQMFIYIGVGAAAAALGAGIGFAAAQ